MCYLRYENYSEQFLLSRDKFIVFMVRFFIGIDCIDIPKYSRLEI